MIHHELTGGAGLARTLRMQGPDKVKRLSGRSSNAAAVLIAGAMAAAGVLSGCVSVNAPDKPIVIELNINIKHELIVQLAQHAEKTMDEHKDIF